ncbi:hypothetical protein ACT7TO_003282 [Vibrio cholerae]|nr:hypothetical protein [Vibrio cholerae]
MYKGFELKLDETDFLLNDGEYSKLLREGQGNIVNQLNEVLLSNGKIDADKIIEEWFPAGRYHVFISHSHKDLELAEKLANWLHQNFRLTSFLDSHIWGYANDLLRCLNEKYARSGESTYAYDPAISNAAHVYLMLSTALTEVIDKSECLFFINTQNTLDNMKIEGSQEEARTGSPWIMHELKTSAMIRRHSSEGRMVVTARNVSNESLEKSSSFSFSVPTEHLSRIDKNCLLSWLKECDEIYEHVWGKSSFKCKRAKKYEFDALDVLYNLSRG